MWRVGSKGEGMTKFRGLGALLALVVVAAFSVQATAQEGGGGGKDPVIAAVGDLVCAFGQQTERRPGAPEEIGECKPKQVASIVTEGNSYDAFLPLGDLQYSYGGYWRYEKYWDRYYGDVFDITYPVAGNHEAYNGLFEGYYKYFGKRAHPESNGYYSFDLGKWHVLALNTQLCRNKAWGLKVHEPNPGGTTGYTRWISPIPGGGCEPGDPMMVWVEKDLKESGAACTLALMHHPLYRWAGGEGLFNPKADHAPLYELLVAEGVDVALTGHHHNYQRFEPMDARGNPDEEGMVQFIAGMGGNSYQPLPDGEMPPELAAADTGTYGMVEMTLKDGGYDFGFVPAPGEPKFEDSGSGECH